MTVHVKTPKEKKTFQTTPKANVKEVSGILFNFNFRLKYLILFETEEIFEATTGQ